MRVVDCRLAVGPRSRRSALLRPIRQDEGLKWLLGKWRDPTLGWLLEGNLFFCRKAAFLCRPSQIRQDYFVPTHDRENGLLVAVGLRGPPVHIS